MVTEIDEDLIYVLEEEMDTQINQQINIYQCQVISARKENGTIENANEIRISQKTSDM